MEKHEKYCSKCEHRGVCDRNIVDCPIGNFDAYDK